MSRARSPFGALGMFSPLSPLSLLNPLNVRSLDRRPPNLVLGRDHDSVLARLYGGGELQRIPFPNMEWWWNAMEFRANAGGGPGQSHEFSVISNVQLFTLPNGQSVAQGTLSIRNLTKRRRFQVQTSGTLDPGRSCRFGASGWHLWRTADEDDNAPDAGTYHIEVFAPDFRVELSLSQGKVAYIGDAGPDSGWTDNNPEGLIPYWVTYRSRFGKVTGSIRLPDDKQVLKVVMSEPALQNMSEPALQNQVRFDHQSVHWSPRDIGGLSAQILSEAAMTRPAWLWYHLRLVVTGGQARATDVLNLVAYELRNGHTGGVLKRFAALTDDSGRELPIDSEELTFKPSRARIPGKVSAPRQMTIEFRTSSGMRVKVDFTCSEGQDFTVSYPVVGALAFEAQEAYGQVKGTIRSADKELSVAGTGTLEVLDFLKSLSF